MGTPFAVGFSFAIGQTEWAHNPTPPPDAKHPYWPDRSYWIPWLTEMRQAALNSYWSGTAVKSGFDVTMDIDWSRMSLDEVESFLIAHSGVEDVPGDTGDDRSFRPQVGALLRAIYIVMQQNGPIPHDVVLDKMADPSVTFANNWDSGDGVNQEYHIYYYDFVWNEGGGSVGSLKSPDDLNQAITDSSLRLQVTGLASSGGNAGKLILPNSGSVDIQSYGLKNGQWVYDVTAKDWTIANWRAIQITLSVIAAIIVTAVTWGAGVEVGVALVIMTVTQAVVAEAEALAYAGITGDSSGLMAAYQKMFMAIFTVVAQQSATDISADVKAQGAKWLADLEAKAPDISAIADKVGTIVTNVANAVGPIVDRFNQTLQAAGTDVQAILGQIDRLAASAPHMKWLSDVVHEVDSAGGDVQSVITAGTNVAAAVEAALKNPSKWIAGDGWDAVQKLVPPTCKYWWNQIRSMDVSDVNIQRDLTLLQASAPAYAQGVVQVATTLKAAEIAQTTITLRTLKQVRIARPSGGVPGSSFLSPVERAMFAQQASFTMGVLPRVFPSPSTCKYCAAGVAHGMCERRL